MPLEAPPQAPDIHEARHRLGEVEALAVERELAVCDAADVEEIADEPRHVPGLALDHGGRLHRLVARGIGDFQHMSRRGEGRERIAQLVAEHRQELVLGAARGLYLVHLPRRRAGRHQRAVQLIDLAHCMHLELSLLTARELARGRGERGDRRRDAPADEERCRESKHDRDRGSAGKERKRVAERRERHGSGDGERSRPAGERRARMHVIDRHPLRSAAHARAAVRRADLPRELRRERLADAPRRIERARDGDAPAIDEREHRVGRRTLRLEHALELDGVDRHLEHVAQLARAHHGEVEADARPARHERDEKIGDHRRAALEHVFHRVAAAERHLRVALVGAGGPCGGQRIGQHRAV